MPTSRNKAQKKFADCHLHEDAARRRQCLKRQPMFRRQSVENKPEGSSCWNPKGANASCTSFSLRPLGTCRIRKSASQSRGHASKRPWYATRNGHVSALSVDSQTGPENPKYPFFVQELKCDVYETERLRYDADSGYGRRTHGHTFTGSLTTPTGTYSLSSLGLLSCMCILRTFGFSEGALTCGLAALPMVAD